MPDVYQGDELVALSLVDPDNRRPGRLGAPPRRCSPSCAAGAAAGEPRRAQAVADPTRCWRCARAARRRSRGGYTPLDAGPDAVAFLRGDDVAVAMPLREGGLDTSALALPRGTWRPAFDADRLPGAQIHVLERTGSV